MMFVIESDPRHSGRAAEALRIASGLSLDPKAGNCIWFQGPAVLCLGEFPETLQDGWIIRDALALLRDAGTAVYADGASAFLDDLGDRGNEFRLRTRADLPRLLDTANIVFRF